MRKKKKRYKSRIYSVLIEFVSLDCGEGGIRTLDTSLSSYNGLANRPFRPLRHLSKRSSGIFRRGGKNKD